MLPKLSNGRAGRVYGQVYHMVELHLCWQLTCHTDAQKEGAAGTDSKTAARITFSSDDGKFFWSPDGYRSEDQH